MSPHYPSALVFSILLILGGIGNTCAARGYRSDQLEEMAKYVSIGNPKGDTTFVVSHGGRDIRVRSENGFVTHIGYRIFPESFREGAVGPQIVDFIERYWLSLMLPLKRQKSVRQQMYEDRFVFITGDLKTIGTLQNDSTLSVSCNVSNNLAMVSWNRNGTPVCAISFPVDHELILGRKMLENDRRLPDEINSIRIDRRPAGLSTERDALHEDSVTSLLVGNKGNYLDCALKSERYYTADPESLMIQPVFSSERLIESLTNLFTDYDIEEATDIRLSIRHQVFGLKEQKIETTVRKFVAYSLQNGCTPYAGIISIDKDQSGLADMLVIMHNRMGGFNHVLRVSVPLESVDSGKGTATARLNAFVPFSNIKNLFKN